MKHYGIYLVLQLFMLKFVVCLKYVVWVMWVHFSRPLCLTSLTAKRIKWDLIISAYLLIKCLWLAKSITQEYEVGLWIEPVHIDIFWPFQLCVLNGQKDLGSQISRAFLDQTLSAGVLLSPLSSPLLSVFWYEDLRNKGYAP